MSAPNAGKRYPPEPLPAETVWKIIGADLPNREPAVTVRDRALLAVTFRAALRISESLAIMPADLGFAGDRGTVKIRNGKGGKARTVAIGNGALAMLDRWLEVRADFAADDAPVFCSLPTRGAHRAGASGGGARLHPAYVRKVLPRLAEAAGVRQRVAPHTLRHSRALDLDSRGVPLSVIRDALGHSAATVTDRYLNAIRSSSAVVDALAAD